MKRNIFVLVTGIVGVISLLYYTLKFYHTMTTSDFVWWILTVVIFISIIVSSVVNTLKLSKVENKLSEMADMIKDFSDMSTKHHYDEMAEINNNLECILDLDRK
nr:MAG TPA: protein of unknown function DUF4083 [Caudoviricetes sp.]